MNKKKLTSLSLSLALTAGLFSGITVQAEQYYPDVDENHWAYEWVGYMNEQGFISGYPDGNYYPAQNITRAEYVTILNKMFKSSGTTGNNYSDVKEGDWYYGEIHAAVDAGYMHGYDDATDTDDGTMKPNNYITREEAAVMVAGAYDLRLNSDVSRFSDADQISDWAVPYVGALAHDEVLMGDLESAFRPKEYMSRAEVASMLARAYQGKLTKNVLVNLPSAMTSADGVYTLSDITVENEELEDRFFVDVAVSENGTVGDYKISVYLDDVAIAEDVNLDGLKTALQDRAFTAEELEKLSIQFTDFAEPEDGSALVVTVKVNDATGEKTYDSDEYTIAFGEQTVMWPNSFDENSRTSYSLSGINVEYSGDMILEITENSAVSAGEYTLEVKSGNTVIASGTLAEVQKALAERAITPEEAKALEINLSAPNANTNGSLDITLALKDAESGDIIGSSKNYKFSFTSGGSGGHQIIGGGGGTSYTPVDSDRDRVVESLEDYQGGINNDSSAKEIAGDKKAHNVSEDMLKVILTNDGMVTFDASVSQTGSSKNVDSAFSSLDLNDVGCFSQLYPVYEDVIAYVLASDTVSYKNDTITTDTKDKYVLLFRAMVETINGAAQAAVDVYNDADTAPADKFNKFKITATNNTTAALNKHLTDAFDAGEKTAIVTLAGNYCQELFDANKGDASLKEDLENAGTLTPEKFAEIVTKYLD